MYLLVKKTLSLTLHQITYAIVPLAVANCH